MVERLRAARRAELDERLEGLRGEIELPIPAASAVKIGGERAYRLAPARRRGRDAPAALARGRARRHRVYETASARLDLRVSSGTYVRAIADALGGHCAHAAAHGGRAVLGRGGRPGADRAARRGARRIGSLPSGARSAG